jgi:hypothetical protein
MREVVNPHVPRPPREDPRREDYDARLRAVVHIIMIGSGIMAALIMMMFNIDLFTIVAVQGILPGAVQEVSDLEFEL